MYVVYISSLPYENYSRCKTVTTTTLCSSVRSTRLVCWRRTSPAPLSSPSSLLTRTRTQGGYLSIIWQFFYNSLFPHILSILVHGKDMSFGSGLYFYWLLDRAVSRFTWFVCQFVLGIKYSAFILLQRVVTINPNTIATTLYIVFTVEL